MKSLKEYNYIPNEVARSLKLNATNLIGVIIPDIRETTFVNTIKGIDNIVAEAGYSIIVCDSNESRTKEAHYLDMLYQRRVDALVLATVELEGKKVLRFLQDDLSFISFDVYDKTGLIKPGIDTIMQPTNEIGLQTAELLLKRLENKNSPTQNFKYRLLIDPLIEVKQSCTKI